MTKTFASAAAIAVPAEGPAAPYPAEIVVSGFKPKSRVVDVDVTLNGIAHTFGADLDVLLVGPGGQTVTLMSDVGGANVGGFSPTFDDEAAGLVPDDLAGLRFQPTDKGGQFPDAFPAPAPTPVPSPLAAFDGTNPNGRWRLFVVDDGPGDEGEIAEGWSLTIKARQPRR